MAVFSGPEIVNSGLVFHYDIDNVQKSWKGEPTVNLIANSDPTTGWSVANYLTSAATVTFETENNIPHMKITNVVVDTGYPRIEPSSNLTSTVTDGFSASFEAKGTPGSAIKLALYSAGSTKISLTANLTSDWQRFTFNNQTTGFTLDKAYFRIDTNNTGDVRYVRRIQVEQKNYSTPYVKGTRTANQAIIDMIGGVVLQANSLTYNSNNTFSFNGTNSLINTDVLSHQFLNTGVTVSVVFRYNQTTTNDNLISWGSSAFNGGLSYSWEIRLRGNGSIEFSPGVYTTGTAPQRMSYNQSPVFNGRDVVLDVVYAANSVSYIYENGTQKTTNDYGNVGLYNNTQSLRIGRGTDTNFPGTIYSVKLYNRPLSAAEIRQNFEALRSRFNL